MKELSDTTAVILAGGLGTRLRPVVSDRPKVLASVHGRPFLAYILDQVARAQIRHAVVCCGYMGELVRAALGTNHGSLRLAYSQESEPMGTGGALRLAVDMIPSDTALVMNGDSVCHTDLETFWRFHCERAAAASVLLACVADAGRYGKVQCDETGNVISFNEKAEAGDGWVNAGVYLIARKLIQSIPSGCACSIEREIFPAWIGRGLYGYRAPAARFLDIGTPDSYNSASGFFDAE